MHEADLCLWADDVPALILQKPSVSVFSNQNPDWILSAPIEFNVVRTRSKS